MRTALVTGRIPQLFQPFLKQGRKGAVAVYVPVREQKAALHVARCGIDPYVARKALQPLGKVRRHALQVPDVALQDPLSRLGDL